MSSLADANQQPTITIIVPAFNEAMHIRACLDSLKAQNYPTDKYEIVIVDNGSTDDTAKIVQESGVRLLTESRKSAYWARNHGIESTSSDWVAFTDSDCIVDPEWLPNLLSCAIENDAMIVSGLTVYDMLTNTLGNRLLVETHQPEQLRKTIEQTNCVAGGNMFIRREAFDRYGLFEVIRSGSDIEFSKRLASHGHPSCFAENAIVRHQCDLSNWEYLRRTFRIRFGQTMHSDVGRGGLALLKHLTQIPWRPGLGAVTRTNYADGKRPSFLSEWMFRWSNRWAAFLGQAYALTRPRDKSGAS